jgi:Mor family transcriptional regulator
MKKEEFDNKQTDEILNYQDMTLLEHLEKIVFISEKDGLNEVSISKARNHINVACSILKLSKMQTALFAHFLNHSSDFEITIHDIAKAVKCNEIQLLRYMDDIDELEKRRLLRCSRDRRSVAYRVPLEVIKAMRDGTEFKPEGYQNLSIDKFFNAIEELFVQRESDELTYQALVEELGELVNSNNHLNFVKKLKWYNLHEIDFVILMRFFDLFVNDDDDGIGLHNIVGIFDHHHSLKEIERLLKSGRYILIAKYKLLENANDYGLGDTEYFKLTDRAKNEFLEELNIKERLGKRGKNFILCSSLKEKKLFYNEKENRQVQELSKLLQEENFVSVQQRLEDKGMRKGFTCLFYGPAGTGKTETVYQIARQTGRDILMVDISETKSKWFGESEKLIKQVFDRYRGAVRAGGAIPILLFNEADAIISKRHKLDAQAGSVDQTENAIQNIILQEIENLEGILIATTNMTKNMDKAFDRRFLYKIEFLKPDIKARQDIWKNVMSHLEEESCKELAQQYNLSGAQIENVVRKTIVDDIISGEVLSYEKLKTLCQEELSPQTKKPIGF